MEKKDFWFFAAMFPFSIVGAFARTFADNKTQGEKGWSLLFLIAVNCVISGFGGVMVFPISKILHLDLWWAQALAGIAGWMGVGFIALAETLVINRIKGGLPNDDV